MRLSYKERQEMTEDALAKIGMVLDKYAAFTNKESRDACVLWVAHTWVFKQFEATPRLSIFSSEYGSGKSRVMDLVSGMSPKSMSAVNARPSFIYNAIEMSESLVFSIDEVDNIFGRRGSNNASKALLSILNEGFTSEGTTMAGSGMGTQREIPIFTPVVMAGVGQLPDALTTRSIRIPMRRVSGANLQDYRLRRVRNEYAAVKNELSKWARDCGQYLAYVLDDDEIPANGRTADKWEPLVAIAKQAGSDWLKRAQRACRVLESEDMTDAASADIPLSTQIIRDIEDVILDQELTDKDKIFTEDLVQALVEKGWDAMDVRPKALSKVLGEHGVESGPVRIGRKVLKGYYVSELLFAIDSV